MTFDAGLYGKVRRAMDELMPYTELDYRNGVVAHIIAAGKQDKLSEDWVRNALLEDMQDGFLTYGQAVFIHEKYFEAIQIVVKEVA